MIEQRAFLKHRINYLAKSVGWECIGHPKFGWHNKSIGQKGLNHQGQSAWIKVILHPFEKAKEGEITAAEINLPCKPALLASYDFDDAILFIMEYSPHRTLGDKPWILKHPKNPSQEFFSRLKQNLLTLRSIPAVGIHSRFDLVKRRLYERWGITIHEEECVWTTVHGDLHWSNLTEYSILDWESWGLGLMGLDEATLLAFSGLYPDVAEKIRNTLCFDIPQSVFSMSVLFITAELLRMHDLYGDHPELVPSLKLLGESSKKMRQKSL